MIDMAIKRKARAPRQRSRSINIYLPDDADWERLERIQKKYIVFENASQLGKLAVLRTIKEIEEHGLTGEMLEAGKFR